LEQGVDAALARFVNRAQDPRLGRFEQRADAALDALVLQARIAEDSLDVLEAEAVHFAGQAQVDAHFWPAPAVKLMAPLLPKSHQPRLVAVAAGQDRGQAGRKCLGRMETCF